MDLCHSDLTRVPNDSLREGTALGKTASKSMLTEGRFILHTKVNYVT